MRKIPENFPYGKHQDEIFNNSTLIPFNDKDLQKHQQQQQ